MPVKFYQYGALQQLMLRCSSILSLIPAINIPIFRLGHFGILGDVPHTHVISDNGFWRLVISKPGQAAPTADMGLARSRKK